jgi:hypothetical protein
LTRSQASPLIADHLQAALYEYEGLYQLEVRELKSAIESLQNRYFCFYRGGKDFLLIFIYLPSSAVLLNWAAVLT